MLPKIYVSILLYKRVVDFILVCTYLGCKLGRKRRLINRFSNAAKVGNGYRTVVGMLCGSQSREAGINRSSTLLKTSSIYPTRIIVTRPHGYIHNVKCYGYIEEKFRETYDTCCTCTTVCKQAHPIMAVGTTFVVARAVRQLRLN